MAVFTSEYISKNYVLMHDDNPLYTVEQCERTVESMKSLFFQKKNYFNKNILIFNEGYVGDHLSYRRTYPSSRREFFTRKIFDKFIEPMRNGDIHTYLSREYGFVYNKHYAMLRIHSIFENSASSNSNIKLVAFPIDVTELNIAPPVMRETEFFTGAEGARDSVCAYHSGPIDRWNYFADRLKFEFFWGRVS